MKLLSLLIAATLSVSAQAQQFVNPNAAAVKDAVLILDAPKGATNVVVTVDGKQVASQKVGKKVYVVADFAPKQSRKVVVTPTATETKYPSRVHAQMWIKEGKEILARDTISSPVDNMYNKLHHHGPAFESELVGYRVYFDKKQTIDIYGKQKKGLELTETMWYPNDKQAEQGYGDDVLRVFNSVGVGALKGYNEAKGEAMHITPVARRVARVVENGPVRTVVEMAVEGWDYRGKKIDMTSQYILYAGHRDVEVINKIKGDTKGMTFATGVMKMRDGKYALSDTTAAAWGTDYPVPDTVKYAMQTCGVAIEIPKEYIVKRGEDSSNRLFVLKPDSNGEIHYKFTSASQKENFGVKTPEEFFSYVALWADEKDIKQKK